MAEITTTLSWLQLVAGFFIAGTLTKLGEMVILHITNKIKKTFKKTYKKMLKSKGIGLPF